MSSFTSPDVQVWAILLCIAVSLVGLSLGAILAYVWKHRSERQDPHRQHKVEERLSQLAETATLRPGKSI